MNGFDTEDFLMRVMTIAALLISLLLSGCSVVMEATRPDPVDLSQFPVGEERNRIIEQLGAPVVASMKEGPNSCDIYKLYTRGPGVATKAAIAVGEATADVFTLGLSEVVFTPAEGVTRNSLHSVTFCYGPNDKLVAIREVSPPTSEE